MKKVIRAGDDPDHPYKTRSEAHYAVLHALVRANRSDATIRAIFTEYPIGNHMRDKPNPAEYLNQQIGKVRQECEREADKRNGHEETADSTASEENGRTENTPGPCLSVQVPENLFVLCRDDDELPREMPPLNAIEGQQYIDVIIEELGGVDFIFFDNIQSLIVGDMKDEQS